MLFRSTKTFYLAALAPLGYKEAYSGPGFVGFEDSNKIPNFFIIVQEDKGPTKDAHFAFQAPDRETVHKFHEAAL